MPPWQTCDPSRDRPRTRAAAVFDLLIKHCKAHANDNERRHNDDSLSLAA